MLYKTLEEAEEGEEEDNAYSAVKEFDDAHNSHDALSIERCKIRRDSTVKDKRIKKRQQEQKGRILKFYAK